MDDGDQITIVTMAFESSDPGQLVGVLARYVVLARSAEGCINVDLCQSVTAPDRLVVISKWVSAAAQRAHFDSDEMVAMAEGCRGLLAAPPAVDLLQGLSAHDQR